MSFLFFTQAESWKCIRWNYLLKVIFSYLWERLGFNPIQVDATRNGNAFVIFPIPANGVRPAINLSVEKRPDFLPKYVKNRQREMSFFEELGSECLSQDWMDLGSSELTQTRLVAGRCSHPRLPLFLSPWRRARLIFNPQIFYLHYIELLYILFLCITAN